MHTNKYNITLVSVLHIPFIVHTDTGSASVFARRVLKVIYACKCIYGCLLLLLLFPLSMQVAWNMRPLKNERSMS